MQHRPAPRRVSGRERDAPVTIGLSPTIDLGFATLAWHGVTIAVGLLLGLLLGERFARARGLEPTAILPMVVVATLSGLLGARLFYLAQEDPARLAEPWAGANEGFAFYGTVILAIPAVALFLRMTRRPVLPYLDVMALAFPFGMAVGRIGDLINGEHYGPPTDLPWAIAYSDSAAHVPETGVGYHSGALYEVVFVAALAAILLGVPRHLRRPGDVLWLVLGCYALGRLVIFFWVSDVGVVGLGLRQAQWTSLALILVAAAGWVITRAPGLRREGVDQSPSEAKAS